MASKMDREGAKYTRDNLDAEAAARGHLVAWKLAPNATRKGHCYYFIGTCEHCGGNAHAGSTRSPRMQTDQIIPGVTRVRHDDYGTGTVKQIDGRWLLVLFDGQTFPVGGVHVNDVAPATN